MPELQSTKLDLTKPAQGYEMDFGALAWRTEAHLQDSQGNTMPEAIWNADNMTHPTSQEFRRPSGLVFHFVRIIHHDAFDALVPVA